MNLKDLAKDNSFLKGLSKGEFCLVIGAGFSINLKNKTKPDSLKGFKNINYEDHKYIPLATNYVSITNAIFEKEVVGYKSAANIWEKNDFVMNAIDLKSFYKDLFTIDEDDFKANHLELYKNILIPDWYHIYTFNFDNVVETIVNQVSRNDFYTLHFPNDTGLRKSAYKAIIHLHGYVTETEPEQLTFSTSTYNILREAKHTLYDPFYSDVKANKKLLIIGTQFDEEVIDDKFFTGLKENEINIYHFDIRNNDFGTKPGIYRNPNYHFIKIGDTKEVLDFMCLHKTIIENVSIDGAIVITPDFLEAVRQNGENKKFSPIDFYLAKHEHDDC